MDHADQAAEKRSAVARATDPAGRLVRTARIDGSSIERRAAGEPIGFKGEAIVFNAPTWIGSRRWGFWEEIAPEAVTKTLTEADVRFVQNHNPDLLLARSSSETLRLAATASGLSVDADMAPVSYADDVAVLLDRGDLREMSFAFDPLAWEYTERDGEDFYRITELTLYDVSVVTWPAYSTTSAGLRSVAFDALCRAAGLDGASARRVMRELTGAPDDLLDAAPARALEIMQQIADPGPADTTRDDTTSDGSRRSDPPADTTGTRTDPMSRHLAARHSLTKETH